MNACFAGLNEDSITQFYLTLLSNVLSHPFKKIFQVVVRPSCSVLTDAVEKSMCQGS